MKAPKLKPNESTKSFKKRVAEWERVTGKKYPTTFSGKSNEERVLAGGSQNFGLNKPQDYYDREYQEQIREFERSNINVPLTEDLEEDYLSKLARGEVDPLQEPNPIPINQNDLATQAVNREEEEVGLSGVSSQDIYSSNTPSLYQQPLTDTEIFNNQNYLINQNAAIANQTVSESGGQEYTTSYQEAIKNSNKTQAWEDTIDSETPLEKSNVFTIDPDTGMPLGVMTRSQRRTWDEANARKNERLKATMDDTGRSASDIKAIHSKKGLETVIDGNNPVDRTNIEIKTPQSAKQDFSDVGSDVFTGNNDNMGYNDNRLQGIGSIFRPKVG
mgnify:CR=1 FL=1